MFDINDEVYMAGEAGTDPDARWEGYIVGFAVNAYYVCWDVWTGGGEFEAFTDVRTEEELVAIMEEGE